MSRKQRPKGRPTAITLAVLKYDPDLAAELARREDGIEVISDGDVAFRLWIPHKALEFP